MTGMEHAIEQVARVLIAHPSIPNHKDATRDVCPSCPDADVAGPNSPSHAAHQARALAEAGLLTPDVPLEAGQALWEAVWGHKYPPSAWFEIGQGLREEYALIEAHIARQEARDA